MGRQDSKEQWLLNGQPLAPEAGPNRGLQFGEGLFETMLAMDGRLPLWERHWQRLQAGCHRLDLPCPSREQVEKDIQGLCPPRGRWVIKLLLTLPAGGRGYARPPSPAPQVYIGRFPAPEPTSEGLQLHLCELRLGHQPVLAGLKHSNRLEQVLARREVDRAGRDEGLLRDEDGRIIEAVAANLFLIADGHVMTPCLRHSGVAGVMREEVLAGCQALGLPTRVTEVRLGDILSADEVFLSNSLNGIRPVTGLDGKDIHTEWPWGQTTQRLQTALKEKGSI